MAVGIGNPLGAVPVFDLGAPSVITCTAGGNISGGALVFASGAQGGVGSQTESFASADLLAITDASGAQFLGIAMQDTGSNLLVPVATRGAFLLLANGTLTSSYPVKVLGANGVLDIAGTGSLEDFPIGRVLIPAASGTANFALVQLGL